MKRLVSSLRRRGVRSRLIEQIATDHPLRMKQRAGSVARAWGIADDVLIQPVHEAGTNGVCLPLASDLRPHAVAAVSSRLSTSSLV